MKENLKEIKINKLANSNEAPTNQQQPIVENKQLITLKGITTSQVQQALKADNPYPARVFLKLTKRYCQSCEEVWEEQSKCGRQDCGYYDRNCGYLEKDIPIFFRIKENNQWIRPQIKTGSYLQVEGYFSIGAVYTKQSERKSFTTTSYQLISCPHNQQKPYHCPIDCPCLKGQELKNKDILDQAKNQLPHFEQAYQQIKQIREQLESHE